MGDQASLISYSARFFSREPLDGELKMLLKYWCATSKFSCSDSARDPSGFFKKGDEISCIFLLEEPLHFFNKSIYFVHPPTFKEEFEVITFNHLLLMKLLSLR